MKINTYIKVRLHLLKTTSRTVSCQIEVNGVGGINRQSPHR